MAFERLDVPLAVGLRDDLTNLDIQASGHEVAENVIFSKTGAVSPRPGLVSENAPVIEHSQSGSSTLPGLDLMVSERLGLCGDDERLLLTEAGNLALRTATTWDQAGPFWSVLMDESPLVGDETFGDNRYTPHAGTTVLGFPTAEPIGNYTTAGAIAPTSGVEVQRWALGESRCVAGDTLFLTSGGSVLALRGYPLEQAFVLATDAKVSVSNESPQRLWAIEGAGLFWIAYQTNAGSVKLVCFNSSMGLQSSHTLTKGHAASTSPNLAIGLGASASAGTMVLALAGVNNRIESYVFTKSPITDLNFDSSVTTGLGTEVIRGPVVGVPVGVPETYVGCWSNEDGGVTIYKRSSVSSTPGLTLHRKLYGNGDPSAFPTDAGNRWRTWFPPLSLAGRVLMGVLHVPLPPSGIASERRRGATWAIIDVTSPTNTTYVACGEEGKAAATIVPGAAHIDSSGRICAAYLEGTAFDIDGPSSPRARRLTFTVTSPQSASVNGLTHFSGQVGYVFDGGLSYEAGWPISPRIDVVQDTAGSGTLTGSRTFAACWVYTDAQGNVHRSRPSQKVTVVLPASPGVGANVIFRVSLPQITAKRRVNLRLEVYMSVANPSAGADLYLATLLPVAVPTYDVTWQTIIITDYGDPSLLTRTPLYTGGNILANERPLSNRGMALVGSRVWCAEGQNAYASKYVRTGSAPAWAIGDDSLTLTVPTGYGPIRGIAGLDSLLILLCKNAVCVFTGSGPGDAGGPSDFSEPRLAYKAAGPARPCDVVTLRDSAMWTSDLGDAHSFGQGSQGAQLSRPVGTSKLRKPVFIPGIGTNHDTVLFLTDEPRNLACYDLELGAWSRWRLHAEPTDIVATRRGLHALFGDDPYVGSYTSTEAWGFDELDAGPVIYSMTIESRTLPLGHLGRVKSLKPQGTNLRNGTTLELSVLVDRARQLLPENTQTFTLGAPSTRWPREEMPELRTGSQRMESFAVSLRVTPAAALFRSVQAQVKQEQENPRSSRK